MQTGQKRCPVNVAGSLGYTALHRAAEGGHVKVIRELIARGVSANVQANHGCTPLHLAAAAGKLEAVHELLRLGGKASMTMVAGTYGTPLHQAALGGHKKVMSVLLDKGCPINVVSSRGRSILHSAAEGGHVELIGWLVEYSLDVNREDADGSTPLHSAAGKGKLEAVHELLRLGGKASMTMVAGTYGTPLHQAAFGGHKKVMSVLLDKGCPINVVSSRGRSILHSAAEGGHVELIGWLVEYSLDVNREDADGSTPLHSAAGKGKLEAVHELLRLGGKASMTKVAGIYGTPLHQAAFGGHKKVMSVLLDEGCPIDVVCSSGQSVLHFAAAGGHVELLGWLVKCSLGVNGADVDGCTPLHLAAAAGKLEAVHELLRLGGKASMTKVAGTYGTPLHQAASGGHKKVMSVLLDEGCPINVVSSRGRSILHSAAEGGHVELIGWLVEYSLDVNREDADGSTPLHSAAGKGKLEAVHELLRLGGKASMRKVAGIYGTPLHQAAFGGHKKVMSVLLDEGCPIDLVSSSGQSVLHFAAEGGHVELVGWLMEYSLDVNREDADGSTPLHSAAGKGKLEAVHELLRLGGKASMTKVAGTCGTPLHQAALGGHKKVMSVLLNEGCPIDVVSSSGQGVLHSAAEGGHVELLGWLVECGLDVNGGDAFGYTPLHSAARNGKLEAVHELLRLGGKASMTKVAGTYGSPLHQAAFGGHKKVMSVLLDEGCPIDVVSSSGRGVLHSAVEGGHVELVGWLVECGLNVNGHTDGCTPLHSAAATGKPEAVHELLRLGGKASMTKVAGTYGTPLHQAVFGGHKKVLSVLLNEGCLLDLVNSIGQSVLHFAAQGGHVELVGWLVECGLDVNRGDDNGYTPLHSAAGEGKLEAVHELLRLGANPDIMAGVFGTPLHQAVLSGSVQVVTVLSDAIYEQYNPQHPMSTESEVDSPNQLACVPDNNPLDCCNPMGLTPLMWAAGEGHVEIVKYLISKHCNFTTQNCYDLSMFEVAVMCGQMNKLCELCKVCGFNDLGGDIRESILSLKNKNLLDLCKLLILGSFTGDPLVITTLSRDESMFTEAARQTWLMTNNVVCQCFPLQTINIFQQLHLQDECPLSPLHISLIFCKILMNYSGESSISRGAKDYKVFIDKLISHSSTKYTVNKLFPNGLSPLDIARQFDFHDIASMIERAGGGPGLWANLPKQVEQKYLIHILAVKELFGCDEVGKEATLRILSFLGYQLVGGEEISDANRIMGGRPSRSLIDKHVLSKLQHKDKWERVGNLLEVDEDELDRLGEEAPNDDEAYYSMLKHWLKHGSQVTWKTLLDAIGHFETKKTVDDITAKIVEELASSQVRKCDYVCYVFLEMTRLEIEPFYYFVILCYRTRPSPP